MSKDFKPVSRLKKKIVEQNLILDQLNSNMLQEKHQSGFTPNHWLGFFKSWGKMDQNKPSVQVLVDLEHIIPLDQLRQIEISESLLK